MKRISTEAVDWVVTALILSTIIGLALWGLAASPK